MTPICQRTLGLLSLAMAAALVIGGCTPAPAHPPVPMPADASDLFALGQASARRGDSVRAAQYLELARQAGHPEADVLPVLLDICIRSRRYRAALAYAERHLAAYPASATLWRLVNTLRAALGNPPGGPEERNFLAPGAGQRPIGVQPETDEVPSDDSGLRPRAQPDATT